MPARSARAGKLKVMGGRFVSAKSKTGDPKCSEAMSAKVNARLGNPISMALDVANAILGKCRSAARRLKTAGHQRAAGNEAKAQHQEAIVKRGGPLTVKERAAKAGELLMKRAASKKPAAVAATIGGQKPGERFSLLQRSNSGPQRAENTGKGSTRFMFDMKRGDKPGQTPIFDKVGTVHTHEGAKPKQLSKLAGAPSTDPRGISRKPTTKESQAPQRSKTAARLHDLIQARREQKAPEKFGVAGKAYEMKTEAIGFDPDRFQYKLAAQGTHGVTDQLKGVEKWDAELAGTVSVWRDPANGKTFVVNGHHRLDLAKKLGVKTITAKYLQAATAEEARAKGALVNIAEGRGTAIDAAKFYRDTGIDASGLKAKGISMREQTASQGLALSGLPEHAFKRVVTGELSPARAAIVGGSGLTHEQQSQVFKLLDKPANRKLSDGGVKNLTDAAHAAGSRTTTTRDLFGTNEQEEALIVQRAGLEDKIKRSLASDKRLFGMVAKSKHAAALAERGGSTIDTQATGGVHAESAGALHYFDQLKHRDPRLSKILNDGAERVANGENAKQVESETRRKALAHLKALLSGEANPFD